jgi:hypothetical protein
MSMQNTGANNRAPVIPRHRFYFLRHGQTDWNREGRYQGTSDIPLNAAGIAQARAAAESLTRIKIDHIIASPLIRALKTAEIVGDQCGAPVHTDIGLVERNFGSFDGLIIREVKERHGIPLDMPSTSIMPSTPTRGTRYSSVCLPSLRGGSIRFLARQCYSLLMAACLTLCISTSSDRALVQSRNTRLPTSPGHRKMDGPYHRWTNRQTATNGLKLTLQ